MSRSSPCCARMIQCHVSRRLVHHLSSRAPYKLQVIILDPATMEVCETLELHRSRDSGKHQIFETVDFAPSRLVSQKGYTRLELSRGQHHDKLNRGSVESRDFTQKPPHDPYSKNIQLDDLDFLYHLCFEIHKCRADSFISVSNLCGPRMKMIRLWSDWFAASKPENGKGYSMPGTKLFTKLVWTDSTYDVGFILSAHQIASPGKASPSPYSGFLKRPFSDTRFYRIDIDEMVIRNNHLLGLFEGVRT